MVGLHRPILGQSLRLRRWAFRNSQNSWGEQRGRSHEGGCRGRRLGKTAHGVTAADLMKSRSLTSGMVWTLALACLVMPFVIRTHFEAELLQNREALRAQAERLQAL